MRENGEGALRGVTDDTRRKRVMKYIGTETSTGWD